MPDTPHDLDTIVLATRNPGKVAELRTLFAGAGVRIVGIDDVAPNAPEPDEGTESFLANATLKATAYAAASGLPCLADDSGLEIDALAGAPGVISSHYTWDGRTEGEPAAMTRAQRDAANTARVLRELEGVPPEQRTARFVCQMVLAAPPFLPGAEGFQPSVRTQPEATTPSVTKRAGGRLPHWHLPGATTFVTFHAVPGVTISEDERQAILDACRHFDADRYHLHTACVMPDHVHLLLRTIVQPDGSCASLSDIIHSIKSYTANAIGTSRGSAGPLWQREYFDRIMRTPEAAEEADAYIQSNPVAASLAASPGEYPHLWRRGDHAIGLRPIGGLEALRSGEYPTSRVLATARGTFEGRIGIPPAVPRGNHGFGYDPVFLAGPDFARTGAELDPAEKNARSHRGAAARAMLEQINQLRAC
ncbi:MAG: hypothetical protein DHS20C14_10750 [Phycisphaeraceae bacterium]|nr:MAG: hypothetical protein DHS20C14_10750 [Phycisphaeraceae bacterium]